MKLLRNLITFFLLTLSSLSFANQEYRLASGDVVSIKVYAEPNLSFESIRLNEKGNFSYPFLGEIPAQGLTVKELELSISQKLKDQEYLVNPKVSVSILEYRQFYIDGEVKKPGGYPYEPGLTVRRAAALAGGLTLRASENKITIIKDGDESKSPRDVSIDEEVNPGDTIKIGQGFF